MSYTVDNAFNSFIGKNIKLLENQVAVARASRDNLIQTINNFSDNHDFFNVYFDKNLKYGSFARHTKNKPLDDIDLMVCFSASNDGERRSYSENGGTIRINGIRFDEDCCLLHSGTKYLNSAKVINRLISKLSDIDDYKKAEMHRNHEAATLQLRSYPWNFDITPCFYTDTGLYLIPDGSGNWKKTDPRIDNERIKTINQYHKGKILDVIRLMKYWNKRRVTLRIESYMLECMILAYYEISPQKEHYWIDMEIRDLFGALSVAIFKDVPDPKGIQGDLNKLSLEERSKINYALTDAYNKACEAVSVSLYDSSKAIHKWHEVFGDAFMTE